VVDPDRLRVWIARLAAPLAFFFAATVLVILVQRALESDAGEAGTTAATTQRRNTETTPTTTPDGTTTTDVPRSCRRNRYRVRSGDTLESISAKCEVPLEELLLLNPDIDPLTLNPGDRVRIRPAVETE
jgi:LysM repeat protein